MTTHEFALVALDEALNCTVANLEMIATGRDIVTGDVLSVRAMQHMADQALKQLNGAWINTELLKLADELQYLRDQADALVMDSEGQS